MSKVDIRATTSTTERDDRGRAAVRAREARDTLPLEWIVLASVVVLVIAVGFGLRFLLG
jgi:hypothetical protein